MSTSKDILAALLLCMVLCVSPASGKILKVPGEHPAIDVAISVASDGDTILIARGTYEHTILNVNKQLTLASAYINTKNQIDIDETIIKAAPAAGKQWFALNSKDSKIVGLTIIGNENHTLKITSPYSEVLYCNFIGGGDQLSFEGGGGRVAYCYFDGAGDDAVDADDSVSYVVEYCTFDNVKEDADETRLQPKSGPLTTHVFRYNTVVKAGQSGIQLVDYAGDSRRAFQIHGNLFLNCRGSGVSMMANEHSDENHEGSDMVENVVVYNNTFHGCNHGMTLSPKAIVLNNIFSNCLKGVGRGKYITSENDKTLLDYCLFFENGTDYDGGITAGTNILRQAPGFKDTKTFELSQGSPAVDAGTAEYADILKIPEGTYNGSAPDLGAKELARGRSEIKGVSAVRIARLAKGINIPGWLWLNRGPVDELEKRYPDADFQLMKKLGFTNVRIPIDMANVYDKNQPDLLDKANLPCLDRGIRKILSHELAIIIDLHSISQREGGSNYSGPLGQDEAFTDTFCLFWRSFAQHLSQFDPDWVILEPMNEPVLSGKEENWPPVQEKVIGAIRKGAPKHSILATGARWSNLDTLLELEPLKDRNIIYNFHFYEPHIFTHQGASWSSDWVKPLRDIPYPSSPEAVEDLIGKYTDKRIINNIRHYGEQRWNAKKIEGRMKLASEWAKKHGVTIICNEWGTYKRYCPPKYRTAWVRDVRESCEKYGIGWCMWTFDGSFGVVNRERNRVVVDGDVARALGLNVE